MEILDISQTKASRHLIALKRVGLANDRREAQWMYYSLVPGREALLIEEFVVNRLRKDELCIEDLKLLDGWQKEKERKCCNNAS
jgi:ArsR family transcriptional regulator